MEHRAAEIDIDALVQAERAAYDKGFLDALECFAWWKDGTQYVGSGIMTYQRAIEERKALHSYDQP